MFMVVDNLKPCPNKIKHRELSQYTDEIVDLYQNHNVTLREIGIKFSCDKGTIKRFLLKNYIEITPANHRKKELTCIDCQCIFIGRKGSALRCKSCRVIIDRINCKNRFRRLHAKNKSHSLCIKCNISLDGEKLDRRYCNSCRKRDKRYMRHMKYLRERDKCCIYCLSIQNLTIDHKIPLSKNGSNELDNLVLACFSCNVRKGTKSYNEFRGEQWSAE